MNDIFARYNQLQEQIATALKQRDFETATILVQLAQAEARIIAGGLSSGSQDNRLLLIANSTKTANAHER